MCFYNKTHSSKNIYSKEITFCACVNDGKIMLGNHFKTSLQTSKCFMSNYSKTCGQMKNSIEKQSVAKNVIVGSKITYLL